MANTLSPDPSHRPAWWYQCEAPLLTHPRRYSVTASSNWSHPEPVGAADLDFHSVDGAPAAHPATRQYDCPAAVLGTDRADGALDQPVLRQRHQGFLGSELFLAKPRTQQVPASPARLVSPPAHREDLLGHHPAAVRRWSSLLPAPALGLSVLYTGDIPGTGCSWLPEPTPYTTDGDRLGTHSQQRFRWLLRDGPHAGAPPPGPHWQGSGGRHPRGAGRWSLQPPPLVQVRHSGVAAGAARLRRRRIFGHVHEPAIMGLAPPALPCTSDPAGSSPE